MKLPFTKVEKTMKGAVLGRETVLNIVSLRYLLNIQVETLSKQLDIQVYGSGEGPMLELQIGGL